jgi:hypothetical protein
MLFIAAQHIHPLSQINARFVEPKLIEKVFLKRILYFFSPGDIIFHKTQVFLILQGFSTSGRVTEIGD